MSPAREGSFNANFSPDTLSSFKLLCKDQSRQYTKVLERLAELYLSTNGKILASVSENKITNIAFGNNDIDKVKQSIEQIETLASMNREDFSEARDQIKELESRINMIERRLNQIL